MLKRKLLQAVLVLLFAANHLRYLDHWKCRNYKYLRAIVSATNSGHCPLDSRANLVRGFKNL